MSDDKPVIGHVGHSPDFKAGSLELGSDGLLPFKPLEIKCHHKGGDEHHCEACGPEAQSEAFRKWFNPQFESDFLSQGRLESAFKAGWKARP